ncbi:pentatricopeptide repeat-containing protein At4g01400, mitochondrial [Telopea speciosissima]|uniref:pentatricopeptide repeat-containing protein At4g01400, mitochondrial n=1 Tax=Telopea speciosissima TaxID=54955 RepID=UPI001CC4BD3B|nr:pentatricopeptide repeat-containing protein At4g01400, mitochondrial [Telopea speciosissima]
MHRSLNCYCRTLINAVRLPILPARTLTDAFYSSTPRQHQKRLSKALIGSPARIQKLIASQKDPFLAKEIFDLASLQTNFRHSFSSFHTLICKLGRSRHFSLMEDLIHRLKSERYSVTPGLFSDIIQIYGEAKLPEKALKTFYSVLEFDCKPLLPKHLNHLLLVLVSHRNYLHTAFDLFKSCSDGFGISPNTKSYNIMMRAFCLNNELSIAYNLFNQMFKGDILPDVESYRILMQGLCRKSQVNKAVDLLEDMLNKGFVPDALTYTTLLNSLCRKKELREAYKLLCRMKVKGCNPDIVHYNTVILGFCREGRPLDACKVLQDMPSNGCIPNLVSYRTLVGGLCEAGMLDEAKNYLQEMISKGFSPHFSAFHALVKGFCHIGRTDDACGVLLEMLQHGEAPHMDTWAEIVPRTCDTLELMRLEEILGKIMKVDINRDTRIVEAGVGLEEYVIRRIQAKTWRA